jgi:hypothetical protein
MCVRRSLSHSQKGVQVYATQIMLCDKRQFSRRRGSSPARFTNDRFFALIEPVQGGRGNIVIGWPSRDGRSRQMVALAKPIVTSDAPVVRRYMDSRTLFCATTACAAWRVRRGW